MTFKSPLLLLLIPAVLLWVLWSVRRAKAPGVLFSSESLLKGIPPSLKVRFAAVPFYLKLAALVLFCISLAGPRTVLEETSVTSEGIDIILAIDASGSMAAEDFTINGKRMNRLEVVKDVVSDFIEGRPYDRIGMIAFAGRAYTVSPLTTDKSWLLVNLKRINLNQMEDGTAIGSAIASSLGRLKKSKAKSKVIILLTDGMNNTGEIDPLEAARAAQAMGVKIYTIGAGTKGLAPFPVTDLWGRKRYQNVRIDIDEKTLSEIAKITGGKYFRATDTDSLKQIYAMIDKMEKTEIEEVGYREYKELFGYFLAGALVLLGGAVLLENTVLFTLP